MYIDILVEEPSMEAALQNILPKILPAQAGYRIITFQGKRDLLQQLPARMRGYAAWLSDDYRLVVLVDEDRQDCRQLKAQLEQAALSAGLSTKTSGGQGRFQVLNRIVIEELEAWFIGDINALRAVYPKIPAQFGQSGKFQDPDAVPGGTWEALESLLQKYGYHRGGYPKVQAARQISARMEPQNNRSKSFQVFRDGLLSLFQW